MVYNEHEATSNLSRLLDQAESGEEVVIARNGKPAVRLARIVVAARRKLGSGRGSAPLPEPGVFEAMTDDEAEAFLEGR